MVTEKQKHILVIDDDQELLRIVSRTLELEGYNVSIASDGQSALSLFPRCKPDLIILDIMMPDINGHQVLQRIREDSNVPVMMLTAIGEPVTLEKSLNLGADNYMTKPFRSKELLARIRALLRRAN